MRYGLMLALVVVFAVGCKKAPKDEQTEAPKPAEATGSAANSPAATASDSDPGTAGAADKLAAKKKPAGPKAINTKVTAADRLGKPEEGLGLAVGAALPEVTLLDIDGNEVALKDLAGDKAFMVVFYRGGWCPFCNGQIRQLTEHQAEFDKRNVSLALVSVDKPDQAAKTNASWSIPYAVLSDSDLKAHEAFKVVFEATAKYQKRLKKFGISLSDYSGKDHNKFAVPSVFLFGKDGTLKWVHMDKDYKTRPSPEQLLAAIDSTLK